MSQQAQNDYYRDEEELAMDLPTAVNEEVRDLFAAGADIVQLDEPYLQARSEKARQRSPSRRSTGRSKASPATTALHTCFGYAHIVAPAPARLPVPGRARRRRRRQISIESAQQKLDLGDPEPSLADKTIIVGVIDLATTAAVEDAETVVDRIRNALRFVTRSG